MNKPKHEHPYLKQELNEYNWKKETKQQEVHVFTDLAELVEKLETESPKKS